jgi:hypothetical protein
VNASGSLIWRFCGIDQLFEKKLLICRVDEFARGDMVL